MNIKKITFIFAIFAIITQTDTIAWRGVTDSGNGRSIVTGSQTRSLDGSFSSSSSSSSSSFSGDYGASSSTPRTTWTIASSRPLQTSVTTSPTTRNSNVVTTTSTPSLTGQWYITTIGSQDVNIPCSFSSSSINFDYCNPQTYSYSTRGNSLITINDLSQGARNCQYSSGPTQNQIRSAFNGAYSYSVSGNELYIKNSVGNNLAVFSKSPRRNFSYSSPVAIASAASVPSSSVAVAGVSSYYKN